MITNLELYGTEVVPPIPREVAEARIKLLQVHLKEVDIGNCYLTKKITDAIKFWSRLAGLEEVGI